MTYQPEPLETVDGFSIKRFRDEIDLCLDSERIDEYMTYYRRHKINHLIVNPGHGYKRKDIEFLRDYPFVTDLCVVHPLGREFDLEPIRALHNLRTLLINGPLSLQFGEFPELEEVRGIWHPKFDVTGCDRLQHLHLRGYKPKSRDLTELPLLPSLRELSLVQPLITSLDGIQRFGTLTKVEIAYAPKLQSIVGLEQLPLLDDLDFDRCVNAEWLPTVGMLKTLRGLALNSCGSLPSIKFLEGLPKLEGFAFVHTNVIDGDLTPLLGLKSVGFFGKKHYSHTPKQIDALLEAKAGKAIVR